MELEARFRKLLLPVFNLTSVEQVRPEQSLVNDLGADSLDFVEIVHIVERNFRIQLNFKELILLDSPQYFVSGKLNRKGCEVLRQRYVDRADQFRVGMTKPELVAMVTVGDLIAVVARQAAATPAKPVKRSRTSVRKAGGR